MKPNNNSLKTRFATRFLRSLIKINTSYSSSSSPTPGDILRRRHRIKLAADHSIARAVRSPRAWKRAVLSSTTCGAIRSRSALHLAKIFDNHRKKSSSQLMNGGCDSHELKAAAELEKLVPGGQGMKSLESLLVETSHYVKCLRTQVEVMTSILHFCNSSSPKYSST